VTGTLPRPFIIDSAGERHLLFSSANVQSSMRFDDPYALVIAYTRKMTAFLLFLPEPRHILMIGLGGGSLAKFCHRHLPRTRISVVEINADVISLREHFSIPPDDERFEVIYDDGATYLARVPLKLDVILIDAFDQRGAAPSLASLDFYRQASQSLTPDGVLIVNLSPYCVPWRQERKMWRRNAHRQEVSARSFIGALRFSRYTDDGRPPLLWPFGTRCG
jgi:spermidine synthase